MSASLKAPNRPKTQSIWLLMLTTLAALLPACTTTPAPAPAPARVTVRPPAPAAPVASPQTAQPTLPASSAAATPKAYRQSGAQHLYALNQDRIYKGRLPPMLKAVGVLNVELDRQGQVTRLDWMRAPHHVPEVMREIERTVRAAAPFPAPARLGKVVYTDTWLWHASGKFQLDTLTEGQD
jgi:protein TonB